MINVERFMKANPGLIEFEKSHFMASVWRMHYHGEKDDKINSLLSAAKLFCRVILKRRETCAFSLQEQLFIFARYDGATSSGIIEPVLQNIKSIPVVNLGCRFNALDSIHASEIGIQGLLELGTLKQCLQSLSEAVSICGQFSKASKTKFNFLLCHEYFIGIFIFKGLSKRLRPGNTLLVETDATSVTRAIVQSFNNSGSQTICLQHGTMGWHQFPAQAKHYYVWGKYFEQQFKKFQPQDSPVKVQARGYPRIESIAYSINPVSKELPEYDLLVISNTHSKAYDKIKPSFFDCLCIVVKESARILVKLHPSETKEEYSKYLSKEVLTKIEFEKSERNLNECLRISSMVYLIDSAAVIEVLLFNKPLLFLESSLCNYPEHGGGVWVNPGNMKTIFSQIKNGDLGGEILERQKGFFDYMVSNFPKSSKLIAQDIQELTEL